MGIVYLHLIGVLLLDFGPLCFDPIEEDVAHGNEACAGILRQRLRRRAGVASAATNHADAENIRSGSVGAPSEV